MNYLKFPAKTMAECYLDASMIQTIGIAKTEEEAQEFINNEKNKTINQIIQLLAKDKLMIPSRYNSTYPDDKKAITDFVISYITTADSNNKENILLCDNLVNYIDFKSLKEKHTNTVVVQPFGEIILKDNVYSFLLVDQRELDEGDYKNLRQVSGNYSLKPAHAIFGEGFFDWAKESMHFNEETTKIEYTKRVAAYIKDVSGFPTPATIDFNNSQFWIQIEGDNAKYLHQETLQSEGFYFDEKSSKLFYGCNEELIKAITTNDNEEQESVKKNKIDLTEKTKLEELKQKFSTQVTSWMEVMSPKIYDKILEANDFETIAKLRTFLFDLQIRMNNVFLDVDEFLMEKKEQEIKKVLNSIDQFKKNELGTTYNEYKKIKKTDEKRQFLTALYCEKYGNDSNSIYSSIKDILQSLKG